MRKVASTRMESSKNSKLESKLVKIKRELRKKERKLKKYNQALEAKQHVQDTLRRYQTVSKPQDDMIVEATALSGTADSKCSGSKSVKFCEDSPEVIFVTPTPASFSKKKDRFSKKGYRSLSLQETKNNENKDAAKRHRHNSHNECSDDQSEDSLQIVSLTNSGLISEDGEVKNYNNRLEDNSSIIDNDRGCFATHSIHCHDADISGNKLKKKKSNLECRNKTLVGLRQEECQGLEKNNNLERSDLIESSFIKEDTTEKPPSCDKNQVDIDLLNDWLVEDSCSPELGGKINNTQNNNGGKCKENSSIEEETTITTELKGKSEIESKAVETSIVKIRDKNGNGKNRARTFVDIESQDLFSTPQSKNFIENSELKRCFGTKKNVGSYQLLQHKKSNKKEVNTEDLKVSGCTTSCVKLYEKCSKEIVKNNKVVDENIKIERRVKSKRSKYVSSVGSCSEDSNSEPCSSREASQESVVSRMGWKEPINISLGVRMKQGVEFGNVLSQEKAKTDDNSSSSSETADTQPYDVSSKLECISDEKKQITLCESTLLKNSSNKYKKDHRKKEKCNGSDLCSDVCVCDIGGNLLIDDRSLINICNEKGDVIPGVNSTTEICRLENCESENRYSGKPVRDERLKYCSLGSSGNIGKILTTSLVSVSSMSKARFYVVLVHECGFSIWSSNEERNSVDCGMVAGKEEFDREQRVPAQQEEWRAISETSYHIGTTSVIRDVVAVGLPSEEEVRCFVTVSRVGDSSMHVIYVQFSLKGDWLITATQLDVTYCNQFSHLFGCALSDWSVALCWNSLKTSVGSFLVVELDVTYSRRSKRWELHCYPSLRSPEWCNNITSFASLCYSGVQGLTLCTTKENLYIYDVMESTLIHKFQWGLSPLSWAVAIKDLIFVMSVESQVNQTNLSAVNPVTGASETFFSWPIKNNSRCDGSGSKKTKLCDGILHNGMLVAVYDNGVVAHILLDLI